MAGRSRLDSSRRVVSTSTVATGARALVVGCGEIGSRHLQAISTLERVASIDVVDPLAEGLDLGKNRVGDVGERNQKISYGWHRDLRDAAREGDLCIVSTMARGRVELIKRIVSELGYRRFLIEKVVTQSLAEYDELLGFAATERLDIWVNCKTRAYPFHQTAVKRITRGEPLQFVITAGNHGLMTNGVHSVDLFAFYDGCRTLEPTAERIDPVLHKMKRGPDIYDLSGTAQGVSNNGSLLSLHFAKDHLASDVYLISSKSYRFWLDQSARLAFESDPTTGWTWKPIPFEGNLFISNMTRAFADQILKDGRCDLPTLEDCRISHAFLFKVLHPHFSRLSLRSLETCPVT